VFSAQDAAEFVLEQIIQAWQHELDNPAVGEAQLLLRMTQEPPAETVCRKAAARLVREAVVTRGAKDNTTAIVILLDKPENLYELKSVLQVSRERRRT